MINTTNPSRVLVTGGTGFIGRAVINKLLEKGIDCVSFSLPGETAPEHWKGVVELKNGDITDRRLVSECVQSADCVIHLAALLGLGDYAQHEAITVKGTENILEAARRNQTRTIIISSIAVYGRYVRDRVCDEATGHGPWNGPYSWAKQGQETVALDYFEKYKLPVTVIRPANVYGAGSLPWVDVVIAAMKASAPILVDEGMGDAGLVHVDNLADAIILCATSENTVGGTYNVCDEIAVSWHQYFSDLATLAGLTLAPSIDFHTLEQLALQAENPGQFITPEQYRAIPLATLDLIGSSNRFPSKLVREVTGWKPAKSYRQGMEDVRQYLAHTLR